MVPDPSVTCASGQLLHQQLPVSSSNEHFPKDWDAAYNACMLVQASLPGRAYVSEFVWTEMTALAALTHMIGLMRFEAAML